MSVQVLRSGRGEPRPAWADPIAAELDLVECRLRSAVCSDVPTALDISTHLVSAGGKRIRPALVVLSALASDREPDQDRMANLGAAVELIHSASLVHDDVVDETGERRGVASANSEWGNKLSVLGGDYLLARALHMLACDGDPGVIRVLSATAVRMTESEILQAAGEGSLASWESDYWRIIRDKTANFMGACCEVGALVARADPRVVRALSEYGEQLGMAFQITDDVLDIAGDPARTGKQAGTDLIHGKFTLPVLLALQNLEGDARAGLLELLEKGMLSPEEAKEASAMVIECGAVNLARQAAASYAERAVEQLSNVPESRYADAMGLLAAFVTGRDT